MSKLLTTSFVVVALILGMGLGYMISPEYAKQTAMHKNNLGAADKSYDLRFIEIMVEHHESAIKMAEDAKKKSERKEIQDLADQIIEVQTSEIEMLKEWRSEWYDIK